MIHKKFLTALALAFSFTLLTHQSPLFAQGTSPSSSPSEDNDKDKDKDKDGKNKTEDSSEPTRFWQAAIGEKGNYMVSLDRISSISRHQYLISGGALVDEVTVDAIGQALVRFYYIAPPSEAASGSNTASAATRIVDRGREMIDKTGQTLGTDIQNMVIKTPENTHARSIEFRISSSQQLVSLYTSVRTAWESNKGRKFTIK